MPFVVPTISLPEAVGSARATYHETYDGNPTVGDVENYVVWLKKELETAQRWLVVQRQKAKKAQTEKVS